MQQLSDITWMLAGPQGGGINAAAEAFAKTLSRGGYRIFTGIEYHSNIMGEHSYYMVRISDTQRHNLSEKVHVLVSLDEETLLGNHHNEWPSHYGHLREMVEGGVVIYDGALKMDLSGQRQDLKYIGVPMDDLLKNAKGVLIIPSYYKASFILGGAYGDGVLLSRLPEGGFSDPAFYRMTAGSIGLQAGMHADEIVYLILTEKGLSAMLNDEFKIGANVGMSIGTIGAGAEAATTTHVGQDIVAYSKNTGLYAGGSFEGAVIRPRKDWNAAVYGVGNDIPEAVIQRNQLRAATNLKDALSKGLYPAQPGTN